MKGWAELVQREKKDRNINIKIELKTLLPKGVKTKDTLLSFIVRIKKKSYDSPAIGIGQLSAGTLC